MSRKLCLSQPIVALSGNYSAYDEDGHKSVLRFREFTASGKKYFGLGQPKRNYVSHPLTQGEIAQRAKFSTGAALRKMILEDPTLSAQWMARFKNDSGTKCSTFNGYVMSNAMKGHVNEDGSWQA